MNISVTVLTRTKSNPAIKISKPQEPINKGKNKLQETLSDPYLAKNDVTSSNRSLNASSRINNSTTSISTTSTATRAKNLRRPGIRKSEQIKVPHAKLVLSRNQKSIVHHPNPFAAK